MRGKGTLSDDGESIILNENVGTASEGIRYWRKSIPMQFMWFDSNISGLIFQLNELSSQTEYWKTIYNSAIHSISMENPKALYILCTV